jgi:hypothetical protein
MEFGPGLIFFLRFLIDRPECFVGYFALPLPASKTQSAADRGNSFQGNLLVAQGIPVNGTGT